MQVERSTRAHNLLESSDSTDKDISSAKMERAILVPSDSTDKDILLSQLALGREERKTKRRTPQQRWKELRRRSKIVRKIKNSCGVQIGTNKEQLNQIICIKNAIFQHAPLLLLDLIVLCFVSCSVSFAFIGCHSFLSHA